MSKSKDNGHIEFRKNGEQKFYAPDRDLLYLYPIMVKTALEKTCMECSEDVFETQFKPLVKDIVKIYNMGVSTDNGASDIMQTVSSCISDKQECYSLFIHNLFLALGLTYIHALRDAADKPVLTEEELMKALRSSMILTKLPPHVKEAVEPYIKIATGDSSSFGDGAGAFSKVQK